MADVLVFTTDIALSHEVEKITDKMGFRTKLVSDLTTALDWFLVRSFDIVITDSKMSIQTQEKIADRLWKKDINSLLLVLDNNEIRTPSQMRLFGAEVISGIDILGKLKKLLTRYLSGDEKIIKELNVLVVDDLDSPRDIICIYLEDLGLAVKTTGASSGEEAIKLLNKDPQHFSCIITDIKMPRMSGEELIRYVRGNPTISHLPIIVLTAYGTADCLLACLKAGASGFLVKPPKKVDMAREIARARRIIRRGLDPRLVRENEENITEEYLFSRGIVI